MNIYLVLLAIHIVTELFFRCYCINHPNEIPNPDLDVVKLLVDKPYVCIFVYENYV